MAGISVNSVKFKKLMKVYDTFSIQEKNFIIPFLVKKCTSDMNNFSEPGDEKVKSKEASNVVNFNKYKEKRLMV